MALAIFGVSIFQSKVFFKIQAMYTSRGEGESVLSASLFNNT